MGKVIVIDLEANQPSDTIIALGYVIGDVRTGRIFVERDLIVNPNETLGYIENGVSITELTGITQEQVDNGMTLHEAYSIMKSDIEKYNPTRTCVQWGMGDSRLLLKQLGIDSSEYIFRNRIFDVKSLYQMYCLFTGKKVAAGLKKACELVGAEFDGAAHNALNDAKATFNIFKVLGDKYSKLRNVEKALCLK